MMPTLARPEGEANYRHIEPLMRAAPSSRDQTRSMEMDEDVVSRAPKRATVSQTQGFGPTSPRPSSKTSPKLFTTGESAPSSSLYPSLPPLTANDSSRRLPAPAALATADDASQQQGRGRTSLPPISTLMNSIDAQSRNSSSAAPSPSTSWSNHRQVRQSSIESASPSQSNASSPPSAARSRSSSPAQGMYPSVSSDDSSDRIAKLDITTGLQSLAEAAASAASAESAESSSKPREVLVAERLKHIQLIKTLLVAINFPDRLQAMMEARSKSQSDAVDDDAMSEDELEEGRRTPRAASPERQQQQQRSMRSDWLKTVTDKSSSSPTEQQQQQPSSTIDVDTNDEDDAKAAVPMHSPSSRTQEIEV